MMVKRICAVLLIGVMISGCATSLNETQTGALAGTALGAGLGAIVGESVGKGGAGTAIGAGAGALTGALIGEGMRRSKQSQTATPTYQQATPMPQQFAPQVQQVHTKFCPTCGKTYPETSKFCSDDGTELRFIE